jgi:hypothetical protein
VLLGDDMVAMEGADGELLREATIFAMPAGAFTDQLAEPLVHRRSQVWRAKDRRALDCSSSIRSPTRSYAKAQCLRNISLG